MQLQQKLKGIVFLSPIKFYLLFGTWMLFLSCVMQSFKNKLRVKLGRSDISGSFLEISCLTYWV